MKITRYLLLTLLAGSMAVHANTIVYDDTVQWGNPGGENSGGGSSAITDSRAKDGNGSLELFGDRTRFVGLGNFYDPGSNLMLLSDVLDFGFDWMIAGDSVSNLHPDATPALRLHIWDGSQRSELIWEGAYNNGYGNTDSETWYTTGSDDAFWRWQTGLGVTLSAGAQVNQSINDWMDASWYSASAYVAGISVGAGSSIGSDYHAFADNVRLNDTVFNFEVQQVPEPAPLLLLCAGLTMLLLRRYFK
ncbi:PEP-CTERM sorting domain-containing protein [Lacimicrobium alkaliphilum]|uniref:PEP-CTERM protein-sorting domain-containing protein n=1 Tax=Lacimicrobium alkaliphilum TaxID=1526571 RepID=A0ABQ1REB1_9ALTE|nr:PEP-CTERM sorting domain-containing protein [Lacimicrobium alkaliphilum]GGD65401.1 hypothetical protein GCM10011357_20860 [Lacimicrobium alkaliphilum]